MLPGVVRTLLGGFIAGCINSPPGLLDGGPRWPPSLGHEHAEKPKVRPSPILVLNITLSALAAIQIGPLPPRNGRSPQRPEGQIL